MVEEQPPPNDMELRHTKFWGPSGFRSQVGNDVGLHPVKVDGRVNPLKVGNRTKKAMPRVSMTL